MGAPPSRPRDSRNRPAVATALAKKPGERFASCSAFVTALAAVGTRSAVPALVAPARSGLIVPAPVAHVFDPGAGAPTRGPGGADETKRHEPLFVTPAPQPARPTPPTPHDVLTPAPAERPAGRSGPANTLPVDRILSAVPVAWLRGGTRRGRRARRCSW